MLLQHFTPLGSSTLSTFSPSGQKTPSSLHHFTPPPPLGSPTLTTFYLSEKILAAQLLAHFTLSGKITLSLLHLFSPFAAQLLHHFTPSDQITPSLHFTSPPPWHPNSYLISLPLVILPPHSYTILPPLAAQLLHHFNPSGKITTSLLDHFAPPPLAAQLLAHYTLSGKITLSLLHLFSPFAAQLLHHFTPSDQITPSLHFTPPPPGIPTLTSFHCLWSYYPLTLTPFYPPWPPNSYIILTPLEKSLPHS